MTSTYPRWILTVLCNREVAEQVVSQMAWQLDSKVLAIQAFQSNQLGAIDLEATKL